jgi:hypothetical protein
VPGNGAAQLAGDGSARAFSVPGNAVRPGQIGLLARDTLRHRPA